MQYKLITERLLKKYNINYAHFISRKISRNPSDFVFVRFPDLVSQIKEIDIISLPIPSCILTQRVFSLIISERDPVNNYENVSGAFLLLRNQLKEMGIREVVLSKDYSITKHISWEKIKSILSRILKKDDITVFEVIDE